MVPQCLYLYAFEHPLTCVLVELFEQLVPIPVLWNVAHKEPVVIERYGNAYFLPLPRLMVIQL